VSVEQLAIVLHHSAAAGTEKVILLGIANHDGDGGAFPTIKTLAKYANRDTRNVQRAIKHLVDAGELRVHDQAGGYANTPDWKRPNSYEILVTCPAWCDRSPQHRDTREPKKSYPQAPVKEGADRVASAPPGGASVTGRGDASVTPPGGASATQTIQVTTHATTPSRREASVTGPRASTGLPVDELRTNAQKARDALLRSKTTTGATS
jgi:hypothetical protein